MPEQITAESISRAVAMLVADKDRHGMELDYSPESIPAIDAYIVSCRKKGKTPEAMPVTIAMLGGYVGEVLVRHHGAKWVSGHSDLTEDSSGNTPVVQMPNGACINPIGKAWRFLRADEGDELMLLYKYAVVLGA